MTSSGPPVRGVATARRVSSCPVGSKMAVRVWVPPRSTTISGVEELVEALPPSLVRYEHFADTGHGVFRDRPEAIEIVREFLLAPPEPA